MGDYVLSLNEITGELEPHKIKGLLEMGIKPVFRLTTEDGRRIRTTGNHPYLVKEKGVSDAERREISIRRLASLAREYGLHREDLSEDREFSEPRAVWLDTAANSKTKAAVAHSSLLMVMA